MTLVLALRAQDGVVLASDGQATAAGGVPTKTSTEKLDVLHGKIAFGCAGEAGLRQRVARKLEESIGAEACSLPFDELRDQLHAAVNDVQKWAEQSFVRRTLMDETPAVEVLFGGFTAGESWVFEISGNGHDQRHLLGEAIGHGRHFAAYAINSAEHYELTTCGLRQVRLLAYRAVNDAIRTDATTLGEPVQIVEVTNEGAERLSTEQVEGVGSSVIGWQQHETEIFKEQGVELRAPDPTPEGIEPPQG
jgi:20S proteasome alpha/beta subunit